MCQVLVLGPGDTAFKSSVPENVHSNGLTQGNNSQANIHRMLVTLYLYFLSIEKNKTK